MRYIVKRKAFNAMKVEAFVIHKISIWIYAHLFHINKIAILELLKNFQSFVRDLDSRWIDGILVLYPSKILRS